MAKGKKPDFEAQLKRLREIVERLEKGDLPLERGVALYKEGRELARACRERLETAKNEISVYDDGELAEFPQDAGTGQGESDDD